MSDEKIIAVVVTFNRKALAPQTLDALKAQTRPVDRIILIDNASTDGTPQALRERGFLDDPLIDYVRMDTNTGGAGGFHEGMKRAMEAGADWIWVMDDDVIPDAGCLQNLVLLGLGNVRMPARISDPFDNFHLPATCFDLRTPFKRFGKRRKVFDFTDWTTMAASCCVWVEDFTFEGVMIHSNVVRRAGPPRADFFITFDDYEYALRLRYGLREKICFVPAAKMVRTLNGRVPGPGWKRYFAFRNQLVICRCYGENALVRYGAFLPLVLRIPLEILQGKLGDIRYMFWGVIDGVLLNMNQRFLP